MAPGSTQMVRRAKLVGLNAAPLAQCVARATCQGNQWYNNASKIQLYKFCPVIQMWYGISLQMQLDILSILLQRERHVAGAA